MGSKLSPPNQRATISHPRFKNAFFNSDTQQIDTLNPVDYTPYDFQYWVKNLQELKANPHSELLFLPRSYQQFGTSIDCHITPEIKLAFQNYPSLLEEEIKYRSADPQKGYFQEEQLWFLLYSLIKSQKAFADFSLKVGDIHPHSVFVNQEGNLKVACQFSWPNQKTNFEKMFYDKTPCFLAPEELDLIRKGLTLDTCYSNTSEAFSIGMTVLSAGLLQSLERYCDMRTFKFNNQYFEYCMNRWMGLEYRYSEELRDIVKNLCNVNKQERFLSSKVYHLLKKYEQEINNSEPFRMEGYRDRRGRLSPTINYSDETENEREMNQRGANDHNNLFTHYDRYAQTGNLRDINNIGTDFTRINYQGHFPSANIREQNNFEYRISGQVLGTDSIEESRGLGNIRSLNVGNENSNDILARIQRQILFSRQEFLRFNRN